MSVLPHHPDWHYTPETMLNFEKYTCRLECGLRVHVIKYGADWHMTRHMKLGEWINPLRAALLIKLSHQELTELLDRTSAPGGKG